MRSPTSRLLRAAAALTLAVAATPLAAGVASASQGGEDHKVTLCHRTNSEHNPYVVITIDKAGVYKTGHDSHDEGGVYQAGDKARGVRWGDIIPAFDYYATPQDQKDGTVSHYDGLNTTAEGLSVLANGCEVPSAPEEQPEPTGSLSGSCTDDQTFVVSGTTDSDTSEAVFRLAIPGQSPVTVPSDGDFDVTVTADAGTVITLEYQLGRSAWTSTGETVTVRGCPPPPPTETTPASGSFTTDCTATGALVDIGNLDRGTNDGGRFELVVNGTAQRVTNGQDDIPVPGEATVVLRYVATDSTMTTLQSGTAPKACPAPQPETTPASGSFTTECTATGALVDLGQLSSGSDTGGRFELAVNGTAQTVSSGQQDIVVPGSATLVLRYVASGGSMQTLQSGTAPAACTTPVQPQPQRGLTVTKSVLPAGPAAIGDTLTYSLAVTTTGNADQSGVTVTDYLPGYAPGMTSGTTTYVAGSASCSGTGTCTTAYDATTHRLTWGLGTMAAGTSRSVSFQVTIDQPAAASDGGIPAFDVVNVGVAGSQQVSPTASNQVVTPVVAVEGVKVGQTPGTSTGTTSGTSSGTAPGTGRLAPETSVLGTQSGMLPHTGGSTTLGWVLLAGVLLLLTGAGLRLAPVRRR